MKSIAVFASGNGTNFEAIHDEILKGNLDASIVLLVVDHLNAPIIAKAQRRGVETLVLTVKQFDSKADYEKKILDECLKRDVQYIVLAGYMRLITDVLLKPYERRIINIHPSLLPDFKGKDAIGQAIQAHAPRMGVSIHYVDAGMDTGTLIAQQGFDVDPSWSHDEIEEKIHAIEHVLYAQTLKKLWEEEA